MGVHLRACEQRSVYLAIVYLLPKAGKLVSFIWNAHMFRQVSDLIQFVIDIPLVCFHLSVVACLSRKIHKKNADFCHGFFALYLLRSIADVTVIMTVRRGC